MDAKELRDLSVEELQKKLADSRKELLDIRFKHASAQLENVSHIPVTRRNIARIMTILQEKGSVI